MTARKPVVEFVNSPDERKLLELYRFVRRRDPATAASVLSWIASQRETPPPAWVPPGRSTRA